MQWLPISIRTRLSQQPTVLKIINNAAWLSADKAIAILTGLLIGAWVARYLGPDQLGTLSYAVAFVAIMVPFSQLGLRDIVIRSIVKTPTKKNEILGTNLILQLVAGLITILVTLLLARVINQGDSLTNLMIAIISFGLVFQPFGDTSEYWFRSQIQAKYLVWSRNIVLIFIALLKVGLILAGANLITFAWVMLLDNILLSSILVLAYNYSGERFVALQFKLSRAKDLLTDSWPLLFASFAIIIYMKIDQIMLGQMASKTDLGHYSVAVRLSEFWYFIPVALASSVFPAIIRTRQYKDAVVYHKRMQIFYDVLVGISYVIVIPLATLATPLVILLFGKDFAPSGSILTVHVWAFVFVSIGVARSHWLVAENLVRFSMLATVLGAFVNVVINYFLIPQYVGLGAAWATVIAYCVSAYLSSLLSAKTRIAFKQSSLALIFPLRFMLGKSSLQEFLKTRP